MVRWCEVRGTPLWRSRCLCEVRLACMSPFAAPPFRIASWQLTHAEHGRRHFSHAARPVPVSFPHFHLRHRDHRRHPMLQLVINREGKVSKKCALTKKPSKVSICFAVGFRNSAGRARSPACCLPSLSFLAPYGALPYEAAFENKRCYSGSYSAILTTPWTSIDGVFIETTHSFSPLSVVMQPVVYGYVYHVYHKQKSDQV